MWQCQYNNLRLIRMAKLSPEQKKLLEEIPQELRRETALAYIKLGYENKTKAYLNACKKMKRKPSKNPETSASEMLGYPNVLLFIDSVKVNAAQEVQIDANYVLRRLKEVDELDIIDIFKEDLTDFLPLSDWPKAWRTSISGMDIMHITKGKQDNNLEYIINKIKWPDKVKNLEMIGRHISVKAWEKEVEKSSETLADSVNKLIDRLPN